MLLSLSFSRLLCLKLGVLGQGELIRKWLIFFLEKQMVNLFDMGG